MNATTTASVNALACGNAVPDGKCSRNPQVGHFTLEKVCRLCRKYRRGAAVVEFAFVAPLFFTLVFGMIEFGRVVMVQQLLTNATREGARVGVLSDATESEVKTRVVNYLAGGKVTITATNVTVAYAEDASLPGSGESVTVSVSVPFNQVSWLPSPMFLSGYTLTSSSGMRRESVD
jgi:Flp pilus assembly protein TadG